MQDWLRFVKSKKGRLGSELDLSLLEPGDLLKVVTKNSEYVLKIVKGREADLSCAQPGRPNGRVRIMGCTFGRSSSIKPDHLFCGGNLEEKIATNRPALKLIRRGDERGLGRALTAGIEYGLDNGFDIIGTMDADLSHDPAYLLPMIELLASHDLVIGSRYVREGGTVNWGMHRVLLSWFANQFAAALLRLPARDITSNY